MTAADGAPSPWTMIFNEISQLRTDMTTRLDKLVSVEAHHADLRRIDGRLDAITADMGVEMAARADADRDALAKIDALAAALNAEREARAAAVDDERDKREVAMDRAQTRALRALWLLVSLFVAAAGVAAAFLAAYH